MYSTNGINRWLSPIRWLVAKVANIIPLPRERLQVWTWAKETSGPVDWTKASVFTVFLVLLSFWDKKNRVKHFWKNTSIHDTVACKVATSEPQPVPDQRPERRRIADPSKKAKMLAMLQVEPFRDNSAGYLRSRQGWSMENMVSEYYQYPNVYFGRSAPYKISC